VISGMNISNKRMWLPI